MSHDTPINRAGIKHAYQQMADVIAARIAADLTHLQETAADSPVVTEIEP